MLGLRFFACDRCDTVFADVAEPPWCDGCGGDDGCGGGSFAEITSRVQRDEYFFARGE
ncbi:hypothetical protein [Halogeometricum limi]|uniref:hypothetical protein n=1 Tax=Halogeometricum limi TaxID=555875 RepID=UPI001586FDA5|nr:hypothetical protein [Halogeometricum limi]